MIRPGREQCLEKHLFDRIVRRQCRRQDGDADHQAASGMPTAPDGCRNIRRSGPGPRPRGDNPTRDDLAQPTKPLDSCAPPPASSNRRGDQSTMTCKLGSPARELAEYIEVPYRLQIIRKDSSRLAHPGHPLWVLTVPLSRNRRRPACARNPDTVGYGRPHLSLDSARPDRAAY